VANDDHDRVGRCAYVDDLVVDPQSRSAGIGSTLLAFVADEAFRLGAAALTLDAGHPTAP
jgi:GNAT superfamily N-acetyltransferase